MFLRSLLITALALAAVTASAPRSPSVSTPASPRVIAIDSSSRRHDGPSTNTSSTTQGASSAAVEQRTFHSPRNRRPRQACARRLITSVPAPTKDSGIKVDDTQVERAIPPHREDNKLTLDGLRQALGRDGVTYAQYREAVRREIIVQRLREREVDSRITVSDAEVENYLATIKAQFGGEAEYRLAHILVVVPEQASAEQIEAKRRRAAEALKNISDGADFAGSRGVSMRATAAGGKYSAGARGGLTTV